MGIFGRPQDSTERLRDVEFFTGFSDDELQRVTDLADHIDVTAGTLLIDQGDAGVECFVILAGTAGVYVANEHVATLNAGSMVGEMALVDHRPRSASVVAETDVSALRFTAREFRRLLEEMPKASERVMTLLHDRARPARHD